MKRILVLTLVCLLAVPALGGWNTRGVISGKSLGSATHTPNTETTWASTPDDAPAGIVLPSGTKTIQFSVENYPIRVFFGSRAATNSVGVKLDVGTYVIENDAALIAAMRFIDTASGASTVTVEFFGER